MLIVLLLINMTTSLIAQDHNTYKDFYKSRWEVPYNWSERDTIKLRFAKKSNDKEFEYGEFISFNEHRKVIYQHFISCPVGEILRNIENFLIFEDKVFIYYKTKSWNADPSKWKKKHKKYRILHHDNSTMMLVRM